MENHSERAEEIWIAKYRKAALNAERTPPPGFTKIRQGLHTLWQTASLHASKLLTTQRQRRSQPDRRPPTRNLEVSRALPQKSATVLAGKTKLAS